MALKNCYLLDVNGCYVLSAKGCRIVVAQVEVENKGGGIPGVFDMPLVDDGSWRKETRLKELIEAEDEEIMAIIASFMDIAA